jgi:hypothetical protein
LNIQSPLSLRERVRARAFKKFNLWRHKVYFQSADAGAAVEAGELTLLAVFDGAKGMNAGDFGLV